MKRDLTSGSIAGGVFYFALPFVLSNLLQTMYSMADLYIVGLFGGTASITAVSVGGQVMHMLTVIIMGLAVGSTVIIGQSVGAGNDQRAARTVGNSFAVFIPGSAVLTVLLLASVGHIVNGLSTPAEAAGETERYLTVCFAGVPFITAYNLISSVFRGVGDSRRPMYFVAAACTVNIALDFLFVGYFSMGAGGAALGTVLSQTVSVMIAFIAVRRRGLGITLRRSDFRPSGALVRSIFRIGVPVSVQDGFIQVAFLFVTVMANRRGLNDAAAVGIIEKYIGVLFIIPSSMLSSVSTIAAHNIGAGKAKRAEKTMVCAIMICVCFGAAAAAVSMLGAERIVMLFDSTPEVVRLGAQYLRGYVFDCVFAGVHFCFSGYFCAIGRSWLSFLHNFLSIVLVRIPGAYFASVLFADTLLPMGLAATVGSMLSIVICAVAYAALKRRPVIKAVL